MSSVIVYYAHPGHQHSVANRRMQDEIKTLSTVTQVDLYAEYPRHNIHIDREQERLLQHDVVVLQFPLFWYSTPSLLKEWIDLVLEHGFAYGAGGDKLAGKRVIAAITTGASEADYSSTGRHQKSIRAFLAPLEQTAILCQMQFLPPYVLFGALFDAADSEIAMHAAGFRSLLEKLVEDSANVDTVSEAEYLTYSGPASQKGAGS